MLDPQLLELGHGALREWLGASEQNRTGGGRIYQARAERGQFLSPAEARAARYVLAQFDPLRDRVCEIGAGVGALALTLAASGFRVIGYEAARARVEAFEWIRDRMDLAPSARGDDAPVLRKGVFPDVRADAEGAGVCIALNTVSTHSATRQEAILDALTDYGQLVLDLRTFGVVRDDEAQRGLIDALAARGFTLVSTLVCEDGSEIVHCVSQRAMLERLDAVDGMAAAALRRRIEAMGETDSGAYGLYVARLAERGVVEPVQRALFERLRERIPAGATVHEIAAGVGPMSLLFAAAGFDCVAIDRDRRRVDAALDIQRALAAHSPELAARYRPHAAAFPDPSVEALRGASTVAIVTNAVASMSDAEEYAMIEGLTKYDWAVVNVRAFRQRRSEPAEREALVECFEQAGPARSELLLDAGDEGLFYGFTRVSAS